MRRLAAIACAVGLVAVLAAPVIGRTYSVGVPASHGWVGTGIWVQGGEAIPVQASGRVKTIGTAALIRLSGVPPAPVYGPAGGTDPCSAAGLDPAEWGDCLVADAPFGALVGMVHGQVFLIGDSGVIDIPTGSFPDGWTQLYLAANDVDHTFFDNDGSFIVTFSP